MSCKTVLVTQESRWGLPEILHPCSSKSIRSLGRGGKKSSIMNISGALSRSCFPFIVLFVTLAPAQAQKYDITPLIGARYGGTLKLEQQSVSPNVDGHLADNVSYGGVRGGQNSP